MFAARTVEADLAQGDAAMAKGDFSEALVWTADAMKIDPVNPVLRWRAGNLLRQVPWLRLDLEHGAGVNSVAFSRDGRWIVTASQDHTARIWDAGTGREVGAPLQHDGAVNDAEFSPDGTTVVTAGQDGTVSIWDAASGRPRLPPLRQSAGVAQVAFSPDGKRIATAGEDQTARIWDVATGRELVPALRHGDAVNSVMFSPEFTASP